MLFALLMASFNAFKQMVLPTAGFRFERLFASLDRALFLDHDPWRNTHGLLGSALTIQHMLLQSYGGSGLALVFAFAAFRLNR